MSVERQTRRPVQLSLFKQVGAQVRPVLAGGDGNESGRSGVQQVLTAMEQQRALTLRLMEQVVGPANLKQDIKWFDQQGLTQCSQHYKALQH
jgi:hypothetical protein